MKSAQCQYCKEEIKADAMICKHCHERINWSREEVVMAAILERIQIVAGSIIVKPSVSDCGAFCHTKFASDKVGLNECLETCKIASGAAIVAENMLRELIVTFADIVWGGGNIDPLRFKKSVRERFSRLGKP